MQTYTINDQQFNFEKLIKKEMKEPILIKNDAGNKFLVMPFSEDKIQNIFLMLYKSYESWNKPEVESNMIANLTFEQEQELDSRYKQVLQNPTIGKSWEEVEQNLLSK